MFRQNLRKNNKSAGFTDQMTWAEEKSANPAHPCSYLITKDRMISAANIVAARMAMRFKSEYT